MANKIIIKRSSVAGKIPLSTDLEVGELAVNLVDKVLFTKNASGDVVPLDQDVDYYIKASSAITKGQVVMFTGAVGASGNLTGAPATGLTAETAYAVMGIAAADIALNDWGYVTAFGNVKGVDTSAFSDEQILYLNPSVAGGLTATIPTAPNPKVQVCAVASAASNGTLVVRPTFGGKLGQFEGDVQITSPTSGDALVWDGSKWANTQITGYVDADVDAHLNTATATTGQVLSWSGTDYDWVDQSGGGGGGGALTISNKTAAYTVVAGDLGTIINCTSGTFTVSLTAAATLGAGFNCWIWNTGTGVVTIAPSGTETVDGVNPTTEFKIGQGTGVQLVCTGTSWLTGDTRNSGAASIGVLGVQFGRNSSGNMSVATSGQGAMALGGSYASGTDSFAAAVANNTSTYGATGNNAIALGRQSKATAQYATAIGNANTASGGDGSVALGMSNTSSGLGSFSVGYLNVASGAYSQAIGYGASTAGIYGKFAKQSGFFSDYADAQFGLFILRRETTNSTATVLTADASAPGTNDQVILPNNAAYAFTGTVVAKQSGSTNAAAWKVEGLIVRGANAASTVLVNSATTVIDNTPGWTLALSADTTNGGLSVTATGAAATNIRWVATIQTSEVTYA